MAWRGCVIHLDQGLPANNPIAANACQRWWLAKWADHCCW